MSSVPVVSVIVPSRNERNYIEACVRSILAQQQPPGGFEVIIADGLSDDGTREILGRLAAEDSRLLVVDNPARAIAAGLNAAIRQARGRVIVRMDAHSIYAPDYIQQCLAVLAETCADNVGGPVRTESRTYVQSAICAVYQSRFSTGNARFHNVEYEGYLDTVPYGCWPREVFERIGLFDEELGRNEDDEFNLRLSRKGGKVFQSTRIKSWYYPRTSLRSLYRQQLQYGYWKVHVIKKHKIPASIRHVIPGCFVLFLITFALALPWSRVAFWAWTGVAGTYLFGNIVASAVAARRTDWRLFPLLPMVFACYHFGYGGGFLRGIVDSIILHRKPAATYIRLTRQSERKTRNVDGSTQESQSV